MAPRHNVTASLQPALQRPTSAQRRAAVTETLANQQATLKQEAADRRRMREENAGDTPTQTRQARSSTR
jgi:hypothetical protein